MNQWDNENMSKINKLKKIYENPEIPQELPQVIQNIIKKVENERNGVINMTIKNEKSKKPYWKKIVAIAAAITIFVGAFGVGVSTNEAFAASMENVPILGALVRIFTAEEIHETNDVSTVDIKIPEIDGLKDKDLQEQINKDVQNDMNKAVEETKVVLEEYKQARIETGTKEEDIVLPELVADYDVKCNSKDYISFKIWVTQDFASAYYQEFYYNYDLNKNSKVTLEDLLGKDYVSVANEQISEEIAERSKDENNVYFGENDGGFESITEDQTFYVNENGNPVIIFNKYEIAPGYMGMPEFEIKKDK